MKAVINFDVDVDVSGGRPKILRILSDYGLSLKDLVLTLSAFDLIIDGQACSIWKILCRISEAA